LDDGAAVAAGVSVTTSKRYAAGGCKLRRRVTVEPASVRACDDVLELLAELGHAQGKSERAIEMLAAADILRDRIHTPLWPPALERHERLSEALLTDMGRESHEAAYEHGTTLDDDDLYELAMESTEPAALTATTG
jgi:hypothetical protein